jgi:acyl carrier protein
MNVNKTEIEQSIFEFISTNSHSDLNKVTSQTMLFQEGIFDSMGFVLLIDFLEERFGIKASDDELIEENFESIAAITNFIYRKKTAVTVQAFNS